jgi:hypothetical protein
MKFLLTHNNNKQKKINQVKQCSKRKLFIVVTNTIIIKKENYVNLALYYYKYIYPSKAMPTRGSNLFLC